MFGSDGGLFSFGNATYYGSEGATSLVNKVVAILRTGTNHGYWMSASDGAAFGWGDALLIGTENQITLTAPIVAATEGGG